MKDLAFFTFMSDLFFFEKRGFMSVNSFVKFHPDIDVYVYRQVELEKFFNHDNPLGFTVDKEGRERPAWHNLTTHYALELSKKYKRIVHFDADVIFTARCEEILKDDWDVGAVVNFNQYQNSSVGNVTEEMYIQNGIVGARGEWFWKKWQESCKDAYKYTFYDLDVLNLLWYNDPEMKKKRLKLFDKEKGYYGCKSLGREGKMYLQNNELYLDGEQVFAYHHARGSGVEKFNFPSVGFNSVISMWLFGIGLTGQSMKIKGI